MAETNHIPDKLADFFRNPAYERRQVIFYDVLGWRNHINAADGTIEKIGVSFCKVIDHCGYVISSR